MKVVGLSDCAVLREVLVSQSLVQCGDDSGGAARAKDVVGQCVTSRVND